MTQVAPDPAYPPPSYDNQPPSGFNNQPPPGYDNQPPSGYNNLPPPGYGGPPPGMYDSAYPGGPPQQYGGPPPGYGASYSNPGYGGGPPKGYNQMYTQPQYGGYSQQPPAGSAMTSSVIVTQPMAISTEPMAPPRPPNYIGFAIFVTICCNFVLGIIAIILTVVGDGEYNQKNYEKAKTLSMVALILCVIGLITGIGFVGWAIWYFAYAWWRF